MMIIYEKIMIHHTKGERKKIKTTATQYPSMCIATENIYLSSTHLYVILKIFSFLFGECCQCGEIAASLDISLKYTNV